MEGPRAHLYHCHLFNEYSWALFKLKDGSLDLCICPSQQSVVFLMKAEKYEHIIFGNVMSSASNDYGVIKGSGCLISGNNLSESFSVPISDFYSYWKSQGQALSFFLFYKSPNAWASIYKYYALKVLRKFQHLVHHLLWLLHSAHLLQSPRELIGHNVRNKCTHSEGVKGANDFAPHPMPATLES